MNSAHQYIEKILLKQKNNFHYEWKTDLKNINSDILRRIEQELLHLGPLENLISDDTITEIIVNDHRNIFYEKNGALHKYEETFHSPQTHMMCLERLSLLCGTYMTRNKPFIEAHYLNMRITMIFSEISGGQTILCIRKHPKQFFSLQLLADKNFLDSNQKRVLKKIIQDKNNFLIVGDTGSGKTTLMQALLNEIDPTQRAVILEDTKELQLPNSCSVALLTRQDPSQTVNDITLEQLLHRALRLRPDRLVIGEIRGAEAKDLLLALSSGHKGSFGSLHAGSAQEAVIRLEMLVQMGAPQWSLRSVCRLIQLSLQNIICLRKESSQRKIEAIYEIASIEDSGFTFNRLDI